MKGIKEQIKDKPKMHIILFTCWIIVVLEIALGGLWEPFLAAGFVVTALIDFDS